MESFIKNNWLGIVTCMVIAIPSWLLGKQFPIIGGPVIAILVGMCIALFWNNKGKADTGIKFTSKYILQGAVVLLGFGMDLGIIFDTGKQSLPIIICTIATSLIIAWALHRAMRIPRNIYTLIGVGSSICGGSAIAATAPIINANDNEVAQAISVIFFYNVIAAIIFPVLGKLIGFDTKTGEGFGIFAGTAINDTSSVTAAASTWDSMWNLGSATLDKAVTVKLTRTLAIIPITLVLAIMRSKEAHTNELNKKNKDRKSEEQNNNNNNNNINNNDNDNDIDNDNVNENVNENENKKNNIIIENEITETKIEIENKNDNKIEKENKINIEEDKKNEKEIIEANERNNNVKKMGGFSLKNSFPFFILYFVIASIITTMAIIIGIPANIFNPLKELSKFCIVMAMVAIGLNSNIIKLIKSGGKPIILGACCWIGITVVSLIMQHVMGIW